MIPSRFLKQFVAAFAIQALALASVLQGQVTRTWDTSHNRSAWLSARNWVGTTNFAGDTNNTASAAFEGQANDIAQFGAVGFSGNLLGINFNTSTNNGNTNNTGANQLLQLGSIVFTSALGTDLTIGKSDSSLNGNLRLNGSTLGSLTEVILHNQSSRNISIADLAGGSGTMGLQLGNSTDNRIQVDGTGNITISNIISTTSGQSPLTISGVGAGRVDITGLANTFTGNVSVMGSQLRFTADGSLGNAANDIVIDGGGFGKANDASSVTLGTGRVIFVGDGAGTSIVSEGTGTLVYNGGIANKSGEVGSWAKQGNGTLQLGGISTYSGNTFINSGILRLATGNDRLPTETVVALGQTASANLGNLDLNGFNQTIAGLSSITGTNATANNNSVTSAAPATLTLSGAGNYSYGNGSNSNSGVITGAISLVKSGTGTQLLGDVSTYTGSTTVNGGILSIASTGSIAGSGVTVNGGTLNVNGQVNTSVSISVGGTLSGTGTITGATSVSGTHNIGNSPGLQVFGSDLSYIAASVAWELEGNTTSGRGATFDGVNVGGNLDFTSPSVLNLDFATGVDWTDGFWSTEKLNTNGWLIYDVTGSTTGFGNLSLSSSLLDSNGVLLTSVRSGASFSLFNSGGDIYLNLIITAVPEPSSLALVGLTVCGVLMVRRRKQC